MSGIVYVVHDRAQRQTGKPINLSAAEAWGEIRPIFDANDWPSMFPEAAAKQLQKRLSHFRPEVDRLLWVGGDPMALVILGAWLWNEEITATWLRSDRERDPVTGERTGGYLYNEKLMEFSFIDRGQAYEGAA